MSVGARSSCKMVGWLDTDGVLHKSSVVERPFKRAPMTEPFSMALFHGLLDFVRSRVIAGCEWRVLIYLVCKAGYGNTVFLNQSAAARDLGLAPQAFGRAIARLVKCGAISRVVHEGMRGFSISNELFWRGSPADLAKSRIGKSRSVQRVVPPCSNIFPISA